MGDIKSKEARSKNMAAIRNKDTQPELYMRHLLYRNGYRYRKNTDIIVGHPDIWILKYHVAIFVQGCFWHRHAGCKFAYVPKSRVEFWLKKFQSNIHRDMVVRKQIESQGIKQLIIWECTIKRMEKEKDFENAILSKIVAFISQEGLLLEL